MKTKVRCQALQGSREAWLLKPLGGLSLCHVMSIRTALRQRKHSRGKHDTHPTMPILPVMTVTARGTALVSKSFLPGSVRG